MRFFDLPTFLDGVLTRKVYVRWLQRKATVHIRRDRKRGTPRVRSLNKSAIHQAVCASGGKDAYTVEELHWGLISKYNNEESKQGRRVYKARFALLPTVDHVGDGIGPADFKICSWRTNDAKSDLSLEEFVALCERVVANRSFQA
jgi:hypothetical protein